MKIEYNNILNVNRIDLGVEQKINCVIGGKNLVGSFQISDVENSLSFKYKFEYLGKDFENNVSTNKTNYFEKRSMYRCDVDIYNDFFEEMVENIKSNLN